MADVTDSAFRYVISKNSDIPHVTWTEFVSADGLALAPEEGKKRLMKGLEYNEIERPIVAQFFTSKPEHMEKTARLAVELGFDGVDINMGCPDKSVEKQGAGAALIKNPSLARELIEAAKKGVRDGAKKYGKSEIPVSVKTRLGYNKDELESWLPTLLEAQPAVITLHARTRKEMSKVPARWERIKRAVEIRDEYFSRTACNALRSKAGRSQVSSKSISVPRPSPDQGEGAERSEAGGGDHTLIFGNGDVRDVPHAYQLADETGCDGVMLGRAIFGDPFLFVTTNASALERIDALIEHIKMFDKNLSLFKSFAVMKKHFKSYLNNAVSSIGDTRVYEEKNKHLSMLMDSKTPEESIAILINFKKILSGLC